MSRLPAPTAIRIRVDLNDTDRKIVREQLDCLRRVWIRHLRGLTDKAPHQSRAAPGPPEAVRMRAALEKIERAIRRLDRGNYGWCELCGGPISRRRLFEIPQASLCFSCAAAGWDRPAVIDRVLDGRCHDVDLASGWGYRRLAKSFDG